MCHHFYADDIQLYCSFKPMEVHKLSSLIKCLASIEQWLGDNYLQLNSEKSETLIIAPDSQISIIKQHLDSLGSSVQPSLRYLGIVFDSATSLKQQSRQLIRNCLFQLRNISKLWTFLSKSELEMIIHAFIPSRLDYCKSLILCLSKKNLDRLQSVQNALSRFLT